MLEEEEKKPAYGPQADKRHQDIDVAHKALDKVIEGKSQEEIANMLRRVT